MNHDQFWAIIEETTLADAGDCDAHHDALVARLMPLSVDEIVAFDLIFDTLLDRAYRFDLMHAYTIITGSGSDDGFTDFRSWLIGQGKAVYENALADPDTLAGIDLDSPDEDAECEQFAYAALHAYEEKVGRSMPERERAPVTPNGRRLSAEEEPERFPRLCEKYCDDAE